MARPKDTTNCGRFSGHENDNTDRITALNEQYSKEVEQYKRFAEARRAKRKYTQAGAGVMLDQVKQYINECEQQRKPVTIAGMQLATNTSRDAWRAMAAGDLDYLLEEFISVNNIDENQVPLIDGVPVYERTDADTGEIVQVPLVPYSQILEKISMLIQDQLERNCYQNKGNPAGSIFGLKAKFQWRDDPDTPQHVVNQLLIADAEQAKKALKMLGSLDK